MDMPEMTVVASVHAGKGEALGGALCSLSLEEEGETWEGKGWRRREGNPRGARDAGFIGGARRELGHGGHVRAPLEVLL